MVGRSRSILLTSNDDAYMIHDDDGEVVALEKRKRESLGSLCKAGARGRERGRGGGERTVTTLARFASGKRK